MVKRRELPPEQRSELLRTLKARFDTNMNRHVGTEWAEVQARPEANNEKLWSLQAMEMTGGELGAVGHDSCFLNRPQCSLNRGIALLPSKAARQ